jgi:hypothetical protein
MELALFFDFHWLSAADNAALAGFGNDKFRAAFLADIPFTYLVRHTCTTFLS